MIKHRITEVAEGSVADELDIKPGYCLLDINGSEIHDIIDYEKLTCANRLVMRFETENGEEFEAEIEKDDYEPLGMEFESSLMSPVKSCKNKCMFCFIDQMPKGGRDTLHFKDDDWRLSLIMGNYVTLTNVDDTEFDRIIKRRVSPLYVSVHATDGDTRRKIMSNPSAVNIMKRLTALKENGLHFHSQIVLCPEINDKEVLRNTINDLYSLSPESESVAVVPVGLTKHREGLAPLRCLTPKEAGEAIDMVEQFQRKALKERNTRFVFCSDEMYLLAGRELPKEEEFEDYPQIENGVGLLRRLEYEIESELEYRKDDIKSIMNGKTIELTAATGVIARDWISKMTDRLLLPLGVKINFNAIVNEFFGHTITVSGLVCGSDIVSHFGNSLSGKELLIPRLMLREREDVFLDGMRIKELEEQLNCKVYPLSCYDGGVWLGDLIDVISEIIKN